MKAWCGAALCLVSVLATANDLDNVRTLINDNKLDEAKAVLLSTVNDPGNKGESLTLLTRVFTLKGDWEQAMTYGEQAIKVQPNSSAAYYAYTVALRTKLQNVSKMKAMFSLGDYKKALARTLELDANNLDAREEEIGYLLMPAFIGGDPEKAKVKVAALKALDQLRGLNAEIALLYKLEKRDEVLKTMARILELKPDNHRMRLQYVNLLQEAKRFDEAEIELALLSEVKEGNWALSALYQRARSRILGSFDQANAVEQLKEYLAKAPRNVTGLPTPSAAYWRLGNAYEQLKDSTQARTAYEKAIALDSKNEEAKKALKKLPSR